MKDFASGFFVNYPIAMSTREAGEARVRRHFRGAVDVPCQSRRPDRAAAPWDAAGEAGTEHEVRVLAGGPGKATVETVKDTGQVLLSNAAYAAEIPGLDLTSATPAGA